MLRTQKHMVGYIDILAGKSLISNDNNAKNLNDVYKTYSVAKEIVNLNSSCDLTNYNIKIFSDNIIVTVLSEPTMLNNAHPIIALNRITSIVGAIQRFFLEKNILTRGGITYGDLYIDDLMVWGDALLDAYELENTIASYPRVVISNKILTLDDLWTGTKDELLQYNNITQDFDGEFYLNYLNYPKDENVQQLLSQSLETTDKLLEKEQNNRIIQKYRWHRKYLLSIMGSTHEDF